MELNQEMNQYVLGSLVLVVALVLQLTGIVPGGIKTRYREESPVEHRITVLILLGLGLAIIISAAIGKRLWP